MARQIGEAGTGRYGSMGLAGWLTLLFVGLKLTGHINWSWWWVLSPITIPLAIIMFVFALAGIAFYLEK